MKFEIKSRFSGALLFSLETTSLKLCVEAAVKAGADLRGADLRGAYLRSAYLGSAYLDGADLRSADLRGAYLGSAYLDGADLRSADLRGAYLRSAYLGSADLRGAYLDGAEGIDRLPVVFQTCPRSGSFEAWKKGSNGEIIKLKIPWFSRRTANILNRKCRSEIALVTAIWDKTGKSIKEARNGVFSGRQLTYTIGAFVSSRNYDASFLNDCSNGIHFYMTKEEAENQ